MVLQDATSVEKVMAVVDKANGYVTLAGNENNGK
jgi:hypothetical protein